MKNRNRKIYFDQPIQITGLEESPDSGTGATQDVTVLSTPACIVSFNQGTTSAYLRGGTATEPTNMQPTGAGSGFLGTNGIINVSSGTFSLTNYTCCNFIMPCTVVLDSMAVNCMLPGILGSATPCALISTANLGSNTYTVQNNTLAKTSGTSGSLGGVLVGSLTGINQEIEAGKKVVIMTGAIGDSGSYYLSGSLLLKPLPGSSDPLPTLLIPFATPPYVPAFASGGAEYPSSDMSYTPNHSGTTERCLFCGFGTCNITNFIYSIGNGYNMSTGESTQFIDPNGNSDYTFVTATDLTSATIYMEVFIGLGFTITSDYTSFNPYVALAVADADSNIFEIIPETITQVTLPTGAYTANTVFPADQQKINIPVSIAKGSRIAIVGALSAVVSPSAAPSVASKQIFSTASTTASGTNAIQFTGGVALY